MPRSLLHHENVELALKPDGMVGVVTRGTVVQAITHHDFPGAPSDWRRQPISAPVREAVLSAAKAVGLKPRKARDMVGAYELGAVLDQGPGYQDREARHSTLDGMRRRARVYLVPEQTSVERRQQLKRAADREVGMLMDVRGGPYILPCHEYVPDAPRGPTVLLDDFEGGLPLDAFMRREAALPVPERIPFDQRVEVLSQLSLALAYCHKRQVVHGAVSPGSVLLRRSPENGKVETRLFNFQLASGERTPGHTNSHQENPFRWL